MCEGKSARQITAASVLYLIAAMACSPAVAEDQDDGADETVVASIEALMSTPTYDVALQYKGTRPVQSIGTDRFEYRMDEVSFRDGSKLGRLKSIRQLSLLTITDNGSSRFYLGVNEEGVFGVHMSFLTRKQSDRFAEVLRMPYLGKIKDRL